MNNHKEFCALVQTLSVESRTSPRLYKVKVAGLAALGYLYILFVLGVLAGGAVLSFFTPLAGFLAGQILAVFAIVLFAVSRSLLVKFPPPAGLSLSRDEIPLVFRELEKTCGLLEAERIHRVVANLEFNCGVVQIPRFGPLGGQVNYIVLGWPLMQSLSVEEFRSVLVHEIGHISGRHSVFAAWIYRSREFWPKLLERLERRRAWGTVLFRGFFRWYSQTMSAYSFVIARAHEFDADQSAATAVGKNATVSSLVRISILKDSVINKFWNNIWASASEHPEPPPHITAEIESALFKPIPYEEAARNLIGQLQLKTEPGDSHPCLADRLTALGWSQEEGQHKANIGGRAPLPTAADHFLGHSCKTIREKLDEEWQKASRLNWRRQFQHVATGKATLECLEKELSKRLLTQEELWLRAKWTAELKSREEAVPVLEQVLSIDPSHAAANFLLGSILTEKAELKGIQNLEAAANKDPLCAGAAYRLIADSLRKQGREEEANSYAEQAHVREGIAEAARAERMWVKAKNHFTQHDLPEAVVASLKKQIASIPEVKAAYLVRRRTEVLPDWTCYVVGIVAGFAWYRPVRSSHLSALRTRVVQTLQLPNQTYVVVIHNVRLRRAIRKVEGGEFYRRG